MTDRAGSAAIGGRTLQTVDRALQVLEYMARVPDAQSLGSLTAEFGWSKATVHRILATLCDRGFLSQDSATGFYRFGWACGSLASGTKHGLGLTEACAPFMRELWRRTEETVYLSVFRGGHVVAVEAIQSQKPVVATSVLGQLLPLHAVSGALVLLASQPDEVVDRVLGSPLHKYTEKTITDPARLKSIIKRTRRDGYAINRECFRPGVCGIAAPVRISSDGPVVAAISVCMPAVRFDAEIHKDVLWAADAATNQLMSRSVREERGPRGRAGASLI